MVGALIGALLLLLPFGGAFLEGDGRVASNGEAAGEDFADAAGEDLAELFFPEEPFSSIFGSVVTVLDDEPPD